MAETAAAAFTTNEYATRLGRVREEMAKQRMSALVVFSRPNIYYLTGLDTDNLWDVHALVLPLHAPPTLIVPDFDSANVGWSSWVSDIVTYEASEGAAQRIAQLLDRRQLGLIGIESHGRGISAHEFAILTKTIGRRASIGRPSGLVERCRQLKSEAELACMRAAGRITDLAADAGLSAIRNGTADYEVAAEIMSAAYRAGSTMICFGPVVAIGSRSGIPHSPMDGSRMKEGDLVFLELTGQYRRYAAPVMRTAFIGEPPASTLDLSVAGVAALERVIEMAAPGVPISTVAAAARASIESVASGLLLTGSFGYAMGIGIQPIWLEDGGNLIHTSNPAAFEEGMTFHVAVALRVRGSMGVNQSQSIAITGNGCEMLTHGRPGLHVASAT